MANKAQQLIDTTVARLGAIRSADGYNSDIGQVVTSEPAALFTEDAGTEMVCAYVDLLEQPTDPAIRNSGWLAHLVVVAKSTSGQDERQARQIELLEDVERAMAGRADWPAGMRPPVFQEAKFINRAEGLPWVGVAVRYSSLITRPRA